MKRRAQRCDTAQNEVVTMSWQMALTCLLALAVVSAVAWGESVVVAPEDFTGLRAARLVPADGSPTGTAVLVEQPGGEAEITVPLGEEGALPQGLYQVTLLLGTREADLKWAALHLFPGGWFTGYVPEGEAGRWRWHERTQPVPITGADALTLKVISKGSVGFAVGQVRLERTEPYWPAEMISDREFFGGLRRDLPALTPVLAAADAEDYDRACAALIQYLRDTPRRSGAPFDGALEAQPLPGRGGQPSEVAELLLQDQMRLLWDPHSQASYCTSEQHQIPPTVFGFADPHDWHALYDNPGRRWYGWFTSANLGQLTDAYAATGEERYARKAMDLVTRWPQVWGPLPKAFHSEGGYPNEYYTPASFGGTRTAHTWARSSGVRDGMVEAIWRVVRTTGGCPSITDRERVEALKLMVLLTRYVQNVRDYANGVQPKYLWLIRAGNWLPEFSEIVEMSDNAPWALLSFMDDCHYPDGAYNELCYYRHSRFAQAAEEAAAQGKDMSAYLERFRPCFDLNLWLTTPMGSFPWINDEGGGKQVDPAGLDEVPRRYVELAATLYPDDPVVRYIYSRGAEGTAPENISRNFEWSGFMVMRTGWRPEDLQLILDGGRNTGSHNHSDQTNIVAVAYGSTLLCDTGYVGTSFSAADRTWYISHPRGHNLLLLDDMAQTGDYPEGENLIGWRAWGNEPIANYWLSADGYDYAETVYDRPYRKDFEKPASYFEPASQQRRVLFLKPATGTPYWVLWDRVLPKGDEGGDHELQLLFHFTPTSSGAIEDGGRAVRNSAERAGLLILPRSGVGWSASVVRGDARPADNYWQGFVSGGYGNPLVPTDCAIFRHTGPLPAGVATVLYPYPPGGEQQAVAELLPSTREGQPLGTTESFGLTVTVPGGTDTIIGCAESGSATQFGDVSFDGRVAVIRRDATGAFVSVLMVEGTRLAEGDTALIDFGGRRARVVELAREGSVPPQGVTGNAAGLAVRQIEWE